MADIFIQKIHINKVRHLENIDIDIDETERKHLILTGKNGSGKTILLKEIGNLIFHFFDSVRVISQENMKKYSAEKDTYNLNIDFNNLKEGIESFYTGDFITAYFSAKRNLQIDIPKNVEKITLPIINTLSENLNTIFLKYLVDLEFKASRAFREKDKETFDRIENWFINFTNILRTIFEDDNLELKFTEQEDGYNYKLLTKNKENFDFQTLTDGYASILFITIELILRMEKKRTKSYDIQGIVLIDEVDVHLHIDLQKKILPFLTTFFPKVQFIVTTHSPFVLSSIANAVIFDLEKKIRVEDLSAYAIDGIVEGYFGSDKYSEEVKEKVKRYENLLVLTNLTLEEKEEMLSLRKMLKSVSPQLAPELAGKFLDLELSRISK